MNHWIGNNILTFLIFAPLFWGLLLLALPNKLSLFTKYLALIGSLGIFVIAAMRLLPLEPDIEGVMFSERALMFTLLNIPVVYHLSLDGLNLWLVLLTAFSSPYP